MRNLKRVLCLALASVMLLGMMVLGASATDFADDAEIVNTKAVEITAGMGLFAGADGKFMPKGTVTRAQMATIIVKMLYGSEINADQYKGVGTFSDTAAFEGGWAEGYINLCANLKVVAGYPDGTFKPGNQVTTAEAITMIVNALQVSPEAGEWPLNYMAKAEEMELFKDLAPKPGTNVALTRDELAALVWNGLEYSPAGGDGYTVDTLDHTFDNYADALSAAKSISKDAKSVQKVTGKDALSIKVFGKNEAKGMITKNQATDDQEFTTIDGVDYNIKTGLDQIGHYVTIYYKDKYESETKPGTVYAIIDECDVYTVDTTITGGTSYTAAENRDFKAIFGTKDLKPVQKETATAGTKQEVFTRFNSTYGVTGVVNPTFTGSTPVSATWYDLQTRHAVAGTYVVSDGHIVAYIAPAVHYVTRVTKVNTVPGKESITTAYGTPLGEMKNTEGEDLVNEYDGIAKDDIVVAVKAGDTWTLTKADTFEGKVTKANVKDTTDAVLTVNGTTYKVFQGNNSGTGKSIYAGPVNTFVSNFDMKPTYRFFYTAEDGILCWEIVSGQADLSNTVYAVSLYTTVSDDAYGQTTKKVSVQAVDMDGKVVNYLLGTYVKSAGTWVSADTSFDTRLPVGGVFGYDINPTSGDLNDGTSDVGDKVAVNGFYTFEKDNNSKRANLGIMTPKAVSSIYNVSTDPIYAWTTNLGTTKMDKKTTNVSMMPGDKTTAYLKADTKFVSYLGDGANLSATVTTGSMIYDPTDPLNPAGGTLDVLLSRDANGNAVLEAVMVKQDPDKVSTGDYFYITGADGKDALGDVVRAFTSDGTLTAITVTNIAEFNSNGKNFYSYSVNEDGAYEIKVLANNYTVKNADFQGVYGNTLTVTVGSVSKNFDISNAKVIDIRTDKEIDDHSTCNYAVTSADDLVTLKNDENFVTKNDITLDIYAPDDEVASFIFVKKIDQQI